MFKKALCLISLLFLFSCQEEKKEESKVPTSTVDLRAEIENNWKSFEPALDSITEVEESPNEFRLTAEDGKICHYVHEGILWELKYQGNFSYEIERNMNTYLLGEESTADPAYCQSLASGRDDFAILGFAFLGIMALKLDSLPEDLKQQIPAEVEIKFHSAKKSSWNEHGLYKVSYFVKGMSSLAAQFNIRNLETFEGIFSFYLLTNSTPASWTVAMEITGLVDGQMMSSYTKIVQKINGVELPEFNQVP